MKYLEDKTDILVAGNGLLVFVKVCYVIVIEKIITFGWTVQ